MNYGKYIIKKIGEIEVAILFDNMINHCDIGTNKDSRGETISAGFFEVGASKDDPHDISVWVGGKSTTLEIESRPGVDEAIIKKMLRRGETF